MVSFTKEKAAGRADLKDMGPKFLYDDVKPDRPFRYANRDVH